MASIYNLFLKKLEINWSFLHLMYRVINSVNGFHLSLKYDYLACFNLGYCIKKLKNCQSSKIRQDDVTAN